MTGKFSFGRHPFFFLRHGATDYNLAGLVMGQRDIPLNGTGRRQAEAAAVLLAGRPVAAVCASPLSRARETAEIVASRLELPVKVIRGLEERRWGEREGRPKEALFWEDDPEGAESLEAFSRRVLAALSALAVPGPPLLVAHSGTCRVLRRHLGIAAPHGRVPNAMPLHFRRRSEGRWSEERLLPG